MDEETLIDQIYILIKNEENHLYSANMISVLPLIISKYNRKELEIDSSIKLEDSTTIPFNNLLREIKRLELEEQKPFKKETYKKTQELRENVMKTSRILITRTLQLHSVANGIFAMLNNLTEKDGNFYNYLTNLNEVVSSKKISSEQIRTFRAFNKFRNVIAHSSGIDTFLNLNDQRIHLLIHLYLKMTIAINDIIDFNIDELYQYIKTIEHLLPKNKLKFIPGKGK